jgi:hypothetical protein
MPTLVGSAVRRATAREKQKAVQPRIAVRGLCLRGFNALANLSVMVTDCATNAMNHAPG